VAPGGMDRSVNRCSEVEYVSAGSGWPIPSASLMSFQRLHVAPVHERHGDACAAGPAGAADPVQVGLLVVRALVVDHVRDVVHVDAAGGHVGGDENVDLAAAEGAERALALSLAQVAVHWPRRRSHGR